MDENQIIENLQAFGLTRQEAILYISLEQGDGPMTGYEVAKQTGISRSNAYNALAGLVDKGAAYTEEGSAVKYAAVDVEEFCGNKIGAMDRKKKMLVESMPRKKNSEEGYLTISGDEHIADRIRQMLVSAKQRVYLQMSISYLKFFDREIEELKSRKIKIVIITDSASGISNVKQYLTEIEKNQIGVITDSINVLTGEYGLGAGSTCLYTGQKNFVRIFKESMKNKIKLIEITEGEK